MLRNVTAIADTETGNAIHLKGASGAELTVDAANVVARSTNGVDVVAEVDGGGFPKARLNITNSSFGEFQDLAPNPDAYVTPPGTFGNIAAAPTFIDAANGNFRVGADSPTLDGGVADLLTRRPSTSTATTARRQDASGPDSVPDMGAYERSPDHDLSAETAAASAPGRTAQTGIPRRQPGPQQEDRDRHAAGRSPRARGPLSLTGSGVKLVRRTAATSGGGGDRCRSRPGRSPRCGWRKWARPWCG